MKSTIRAHLVLPSNLVEELDRRVGKGKRSETVAALIEEWLKREKRVEIFTRLAGFAKAEDHPEWATDEDINEWVRGLRGEYNVPRS